MKVKVLIIVHTAAEAFNGCSWKENILWKQTLEEVFRDLEGRV